MINDVRGRDLNPGSVSVSSHQNTPVVWQPTYHHFDVVCEWVQPMRNICLKITPLNQPDQQLFYLRRAVSLRGYKVKSNRVHDMWPQAIGNNFIAAFQTMII